MKRFPTTEYYHRVRDERIPKEIGNSENIILTLKGMKELAHYYQEKYFIDIIPFGASMLSGAVSAANVFCEQLDLKKQEVLSSAFYRCGFVFHNLLTGRHGHATPIIWEKLGEEEHLFFLDSGPFSMNIPDDKIDSDERSNIKINRHTRELKQFRDTIQAQMPTIKIWVPIGNRQIDYSSCTIDAMVILKDGLRTTGTLTEQAMERISGQQQGVYLFRMPEHLLKTAQISSFVSRDSRANMDEKMHVHHVKNNSGKHTGIDEDVTLRHFRERYAVPVSVKGEMKFFGSYTIQKGTKIANVLRSRWEKKQDAERTTEPASSQDSEEMASHVPIK